MYMIVIASGVFKGGTDPKTPRPTFSWTKADANSIVVGEDTVWR